MKKLTRFVACILAIALLCGLTASFASAEGKSAVIKIQLAAEEKTLNIDVQEGTVLIIRANKGGKMVGVKMFKCTELNTSESVDFSSVEADDYVVFYLEDDTYKPMGLDTIVQETDELPVC